MTNRDPGRQTLPSGMVPGRARSIVLSRVVQREHARRKQRPAMARRGQMTRGCKPRVLPVKDGQDRASRRWSLQTNSCAAGCLGPCVRSGVASPLRPGLVRESHRHHRPHLPGRHSGLTTTGQRPTRIERHHAHSCWLPSWSPSCSPWSSWLRASPAASPGCPRAGV